MRLTIAWLRVDLRRRWRSLAVLALLIAVAGGTVLTAVAGARRGDSVLARLTENALPATAVVLPNQPGFDWDRVRAMPEVEAMATFLLGLQFPVEGQPDDNGFGFPPGDDAWFHTIERPVILSGRLYDSNRADEAVATPLYMQRFHTRLGDSLTVHLFTPQQVLAASRLDQDPGEPKGPRVKIRIVGVGMSPWGHDLPGGGNGGMQPSPGFAKQYRANFYGPGSYTNALVRLRGGEAALPAFQAHLAKLTGRPDIDVWNRPAQLRQEQRGFAFEARSLLAFGFAALVAALFLIGQAVARYAAAGIADLQVVRALGMTPRQAVMAAAAGPFLAALGGITVGVAAAGTASRWFPIGAAALAESQPGVRLDWPVLGLGWVVVPLLVLAASVAAAWPALGSRRASATNRRSAVAAATARSGMPVPIVVGTRFALEAGRGRTAVPVRPALVGAVAGVLGVIGAFTFSSGVADAVDNPARFGQTWQLGSFLGYNDTDVVPAARALLTRLAGDPDVRAVNDARLAVAHASTGGTAVTLFTFDPVGTPIETVLTQGRLPHSDTEVVLAPVAAAALNAKVGSSVPFTGATGSQQLTVVGIGFVPASPHNDYSDGGWVTPDGYRALFGAKLKFHFAQIELRPKADQRVVQARLQKLIDAVPGAQAAQPFVAADTFPPPVAQLREVRGLPIALGVFLMLLALGAVGHALATAVRRRRVDVAVLRALGMTRWQSRGVVVTQASVLALVGLAFGVPLGLALGRTVWRVVADYTPLEYAPPVAVWALLLVGPSALLVANLLAAWPGQRAARLRIGHVLRAE